MPGSRFRVMRYVLAVGATAFAQDISASPIVIEGKFDTATELPLIPARIGDARLWCALETRLSGPLVVNSTYAAGPAVGSGRPSIALSLTKRL